MHSNSPDWHLQAWLRHFGKKQAALTNELGWNKSKANHVWHSRQEYRRETVNELADWLGIEPFELLMPPQDALAIRRLRELAAQIVSETQPPAAAEEAPAPAKRQRTAS
jgi:hypothetical protein